MKRTLLYVWLAMVSFLNATAREIAPTEALQNALMALEDDAEAKEILQNGADLHLMYTQKSGEKTLFYVFETTEGGFLVASANDNANAVLGYTGNGTFREDVSGRRIYILMTGGQQCDEPQTKPNPFTLQHIMFQL